MCKAPNQSELSKCQYGSGSPRSLLCCPLVSIVTIIRIIHEKTTAGIVAFANSPKSVPILVYLSSWPRFGRRQTHLFYSNDWGGGESYKNWSILLVHPLLKGLPQQ